MQDYIEEKVLNFLQKNKIFDEKDKLLVGFSGGADSLCLVFVLKNILKQRNELQRLVCVHFNHNQRKEESDFDEIFCKNFCKKHNITFFSEKNPDDSKLSENDARILRFNFFKKQALKLETQKLFLAHNLDDCAETFLYRTIKGTSTFGLKSILPCKKIESLIILRPLLTISRKEIEEFLEKNRQNFVTDSSNLENDFARNKIRNLILPVCKSINQEYKNKIYSLISHIREEQEFLDKILKTEIDKILIPKRHCFEYEIEKFDTLKFLNLDKVLQKRHLANLLRKNKIDCEKDKIEETLEFLKQNSNSKCGKTKSLNKNLFFFVSKKCFYAFKKQQRSCFINSEGSDVIEITNFDKRYRFKDFEIYFEKICFENLPLKFCEPKSLEIFVNIEKSMMPLFLRYRKPSDIFSPFGMTGKMKLKKFFINEHIAKHYRDNIILLSSRKEVLWCIGLAVSNSLKIGEKSDNIYRIKIERHKNDKS